MCIFSFNFFFRLIKNSSKNILVLDKKMIANECVRRLTSLAEYALSLGEFC